VVGASIVLISPFSICTKYTAKLKFKEINNIAEYKGLILRLNNAKAQRAQWLLAKINPQVVQS
jgi:hypothetical protein